MEIITNNQIHLHPGNIYSSTPRKAKNQSYTVAFSVKILLCESLNVPLH